MLQTNTVEENTLVLLKNLQQVPLLSNLYLVGGTALALQLGHRHSVDLDFFGIIDANGASISNELYERGFNVTKEHETKSIKVFSVNGIKVDIVNYPLDWIEPPIETDGVKMAGLKDIAAMKLQAISGRGRKKDFIDFYFLLQHFSLDQMLEFYQKKFPHNAIFAVIRSLSYFKDAEDDVMPKMFIPVDWEEIKSTVREALAGGVA